MWRRPVFAAFVLCSLLSIIFLATVYQPWQYIDHFSDSPIQGLSLTPTNAPQKAITIKDLTITIKTTKRFHEKRILILLRTWLKFAINQVRVVRLFVGFFLRVGKIFFMKKLPRL